MFSKCRLESFRCSVVIKARNLKAKDLSSKAKDLSFRAKTKDVSFKAKAKDLSFKSKNG